MWVGGLLYIVPIASSARSTPRIHTIRKKLRFTRIAHLSCAYIRCSMEANSSRARRFVCVGSIPMVSWSAHCPSNNADVCFVAANICNGSREGIEMSIAGSLISLLGNVVVLQTLRMCAVPCHGLPYTSMNDGNLKAMYADGIAELSSASTVGTLSSKALSNGSGSLSTLRPTPGTLPDRAARALNPIRF